MKNVIMCGLAYGCPCSKRINQCPFIPTDHLSLAEKVEWIKSLKNEEIEKALEHHRSCIMHRHKIFSKKQTLC